MHIPLLLLALLGHALLWVALLNRIHGVVVPRWANCLLSLLCLACLVLVPLWFGWWLLPAGLGSLAGFHGLTVPRAAMLYLGTCWVAAGLGIGWWIWRGVLRRPPHVLRFQRTRSVELARDRAAPASEEHSHHFLVHLPGNESLQLDLTERMIDVPRLAPALDGLSIVHFSDFHFTGRVGKGYFQEVVRRANEIQPDLVAITGDLVDHSDCIDWIPDTLGRLSGRYGVYFVLGNHDIRIDTDRLRKALTDSGLVDLGGRWMKIDILGEPVVLAGNELPWLAPAADMTRCPQRTPGGGPLRIVLSHSPDQLDWAQAHDADLLLAGHTHGGQIRFPLIGAILTPSRVGVKYSSGIFYAPPTIMHVTRGVSGRLPVRLNCPPEMARLVLRAQRLPV